MAADVLPVVRALSVLLVICFAQISTVIANDVRQIQDVRIRKYVYGQTYQIDLNKTIEYVFEHDEKTRFLDSEFPARVTVVSPFSNRNFPVFITARQQKGILSWQLPIIIDERELYSLSRTLCPNGNYVNNNGTINVASHPAVHIYTSSLSSVQVTLRIDLVKDFYLTLNEKRTIAIRPSEPTVYFYSFNNDGSETSVDKSPYDKMVVPDMKNRNASRTVIFKMNSEDDNCMLISIQNASCPIYDTENDIMFEGFYETVSRRGGITVMESRFPYGFYVILLVKTTDVDCTGYNSNYNISRFTNFFDFGMQLYDSPDETLNPLGIQSMNQRIKNIQFEITPTITYLEYVLATMFTILIIFILYFTFLLGVCIYKAKPMTLDEVDNQDKVSSEILKAIKNLAYKPEFHPHLYDVRTSYALQFLENSDCPANNLPTSQIGSCQSMNSPVENNHNGEIYLNQLCKTNTHTLSKQSALYVWHLITVAVFYGLPVIQLVITYQRVLNRSGNQDLCYYNFLCAHPLGYLSDFNHVYSNLGYILLGVLFLIIVWRRRKQHLDSMFDEHFGIPQHYGLYYAMGVALMMEGVLSASYHVCPNNSNFQFDTSFMYIMAVLCMVKIYQTRHPDINARAHSTFGVLAAAIFICLIGVLYPNFYFWLFFTILHVATCLLLTFQIYYLGNWKFKFCFCTNVQCKKFYKPTYRYRFVLVAIANLCNLGLAIYGLYMHSKDFATHLLYVFLMNLFLHLTFYITMKVTKGERPPIYTWMLLIVAVITWGGALFFFFSPSTSWALTPAQSRAYNTECKLFNFYDNHDIWHMLSAGAMFFSFMLLLTLDDDISHKPRTNIHVF